MKRVLRAALVSVLGASALVVVPSAPVVQAGSTVIEGYVSGPGDGPLEGVVVSLTTDPGFQQAHVELASTFTDASGYYRIDTATIEVPATPAFLNIVDPEGIYGGRFLNQVDLTTEGTIQFSAGLEPGGRLVGMVRGVNGFPVQGSCATVTDAAGNLVVPYAWPGTCADWSGQSSLPTLPPGPLTISFGTPNPRLWWELLGQPFEVVAGEITRFDVTLPAPPPTTLTGMVADEATGEPLVGIKVGVHNVNAWGEQFQWYVLSQGDGTFTMNLDGFDATGSPFVVDVIDEAGVYTSEFGYEVSVQPGYSEAIGFALAQGATFTGTITDSASGGPIANACVVIEDLAGNPVVPSGYAPCSDADGGYRTLAVPPGEYQLRVSPTRRYYERTTGPVSTAIGATGVVDVTLDPVPATLVTGVVTDSATGEPLPGINVRAAISFGPFGEVTWAEALTNADGEYTVDVSDFDTTGWWGGSLQIGFIDRAGSHAPRFLQIQPQFGYVEALSVAMDAGGRVTATVIDTNGDPVPGACLSLTTGGYSPVFPYPFSEPWCSDATGVIVTPGVPTGSYLYSVGTNSNAYGELYWQPIDVGLGDNPIQVVLESFDPQPLTGTVRNSDGSPAGGAQVRVVVDGEFYEPADIVTAAPDGTYLAVVRGGTYDVLAYGGEQAAFVRGVDVTAPATLDITLQPDPVAPITVSGHIDVLAGSTGSVNVICDTVPPYAGMSAPVGPDGTYTVTLEARRVTPCRWEASMSGGFDATSLTVSRRLDVSSGEVTLDLAAPGQFPVRLIDTSGVPLSGTGGMSLRSSLTMADGWTATAFGYASASMMGTSEWLVPSYEPSQLSYNVYVNGGPYLSATVDVTGLDHYDIVLAIEPVVVRGTVPLPAGWTGTVSLSCPTGYQTAPLNPDGSYQLTAGYGALPVDCQWGLQLSTETWWSSFMISRPVTVVPGGTTLDLPAPRPFQIAVVNVDHEPVTADWITAATNDQVVFADGVVTSVYLFIQRSAASSMVVPIWTATAVSGTVSVAGDYRSYTADTTVADRYEVVVTPAQPVTISGTLAGLAGIYGYVSASCPSGGSGSPVAPDGSYSFVVWARAGDGCTWSLNANDWMTNTSLSAARTFVADPAGVVIDLGAPGSFTLDVVDTTGAPQQLQWGNANLSGDVTFPDGTIGSFNSSTQASYGSESVALRSYSAKRLGYGLSLAIGGSVSGADIDVDGQSSYTVTVDPITSEFSGTVGLPDGWSARVDVACNGGAGQTFTAPDGSYAITVGALAGSPCTWTVNGYLAGRTDVWFNTSRTIMPNQGQTIVDLPMPEMFEVAVVDEASQPVQASNLSAQITGVVTFSDGVTSSTTSTVGDSSVTSIMIPTWGPQWLNGNVGIPGYNSWFSAPVGGMSRYEVVVPTPTEVLITGTVGLPDGWSASVDVSCPASTGTSPIEADGTYAITVAVVGTQSCQWVLRPTNGLVSSTVSRWISVGDVPALDVSIPTLALFTIEVVDQFGAPYPASWLSGSVSGTVAFADGSTGDSYSSFYTSGAASVWIAIGQGTALFAYGSGGHGQWIYENVPISGSSHSIVVTRPDLATVTGTIDLSGAAGWSGTVTVTCPGGMAQRYVAPWNPSYSLEVDVTWGTDCQWSLSADGYPATFYLQRPLDLSSRSADVSVSAPGTFTIDIVDAAGNPAYAWWFVSSVTGSIGFADGITGTATTSLNGSGTSFAVPVWTPGVLSYTAYANTTVSGTVDVSGMTGYAIELPDLVPPETSVTGVFDGQVFTYGETPAPGCSTTDDVGVATEATLTVSQIAGGPGVGDFVATCSGATDFGGNTAQDVSVSYSIRYALATPVFLGGSPVVAPAVNEIRRGDKVSMRWFLYDVAGITVKDASAVVGVETWNVDCTNFDALIEPPASGGTAVSGVTMKRGGEFRFELKTPKRAACTVVAIHLADATSIVVKLRST